MQKPMLLVALGVLVALPQAARADWMDYGLQSICEPSAKRMVILPVALWNTEADHSDQVCVFSNGRKVLARAGLGSVRPYGMGGANPDKWLSIWIDERKVVTKRYYGCGGEGVCGLYFVITDHGLETCAFPLERHVTYQKFDLTEKASHSCTLTPNNQFPLETDRVEYPQPGDPIPPEPGTIVVTHADDMGFCQKFLADEFNFYRKFAWEPIVPQGGERVESHPAQLQGEIGRRLLHSIYDVDNDRTTEHVYRYSEETNYRDADIYFIFEEGHQPPDGTPIENLDELVRISDRVFPQEDIDDGFYQLHQWPKGSSTNVRGFRTRYLRSNPFVYEENVYFDTRSREEHLLNILSVIRLDKDGGATDMCYFRVVKKHY